MIHDCNQFTFAYLPCTLSLVRCGRIFFYFRSIYHEWFLAKHSQSCLELHHVSMLGHPKTSSSQTKLTILQYHCFTGVYGAVNKNKIKNDTQYVLFHEVFASHDFSFWFFSHCTFWGTESTMHQHCTCNGSTVMLLLHFLIELTCFH